MRSGCSSTPASGTGFRPRRVFESVQTYRLSACVLTTQFSTKFAPKRSPHWRCYDGNVYAQKFRVELVIGGERRASPMEWLDQFCMRNFTNAAEFDDTLPLEDGVVEVSFRVTPERFAESFGAWLTQRGKGEGREVRVEVSRLS
jgi:hypothetical protein